MDLTLLKILQVYNRIQNTGICVQNTPPRNRKTLPIFVNFNLQPVSDIDFRSSLLRRQIIDVSIMLTHHFACVFLHRHWLFKSIENRKKKKGESV